MLKCTFYTITFFIFICYLEVFKKISTHTHLRRWERQRGWLTSEQPPSPGGPEAQQQPHPPKIKPKNTLWCIWTIIDELIQATWLVNPESCLVMVLLETNHIYWRTATDFQVYKQMYTDLWAQWLRWLKHVEKLRVVDLKQHTSDLACQARMHVLDQGEQTLTCRRKNHH